jgi:hypothetical protein
MAESALKNFMILILKDRDISICLIRILSINIKHENISVIIHIKIISFIISKPSHLPVQLSQQPNQTS